MSYSLYSLLPLNATSGSKLTEICCSFRSKSQIRNLNSQNNDETTSGFSFLSIYVFSLKNCGATLGQTGRRTLSDRERVFGNRDSR